MVGFLPRLLPDMHPDYYTILYTNYNIKYLIAHTSPVCPQYSLYKISHRLVDLNVNIVGVCNYY